MPRFMNKLSLADLKIILNHCNDHKTPEDGGETDDAIAALSRFVDDVQEQVNGRIADLKSDLPKLEAGDVEIDDYFHVA